MFHMQEKQLSLSLLFKKSVHNAIRHFSCSFINKCYGKCPKNSITKASDKMTYANSVDPDQTAPEGAV